MVTEHDELGPRRVVISGVGAITAAGPTAPDFWQALLDARIATTALTGMSRPAAGGAIADYQGPAGVPAWLLARMNRASWLGLDAAIQAVADARIVFQQENAFAVGAVSGIAHPHGAGRNGEGWASLGSGLAGATIGLNIAGPAYTVSAGGASGVAAIAQAAGMIRNGVVRAAVAVGAEAALEPDVWEAWKSIGLLDPGAEPDAQRPYDARRQGLVLGEGAAALLLEDRQLATQRGARIYAEIAGEAQTAGPPGDGRPPTDVEVARRAIGDALRRAELSPGAIDVIFAAGIGTPEGDPRETDILERSFGGRIRDMYITTSTPVTGYTIGASGALNAVAAAICLAEETIPPHASWSQLDPACGLDFVTRVRSDHVIGAVVAGYGAHGQNAAIALTQHRAASGDELPMAL